MRRPAPPRRTWHETIATLAQLSPADRRRVLTEAAQLATGDRKVAATATGLAAAARELAEICREVDEALGGRQSAEARA